MCLPKVLWCGSAPGKSGKAPQTQKTSSRIKTRKKTTPKPSKVQRKKHGFRKNKLNEKPKANARTRGNQNCSTKPKTRCVATHLSQKGYYVFADYYINIFFLRFFNFGSNFYFLIFLKFGMERKRRSPRHVKVTKTKNGTLKENNENEFSSTPATTSEDIKPETC